MNNNFNIWKTIEIGKISSISGLQSALNINNCYLDNRSIEMINSPYFSLSNERKLIKLICVSPHDLGIKNIFFNSYQRMCNSALSQGLNLCPAEIGPQICLQLNSHNITEDIHLSVAMNPIPILNVKFPCIFSLNLYSKTCVEKKKLIGEWYHTKNLWRHNSVKFVFCL